MIVGLGIDLVEVARIESAVERFGRRFLDRVLLPAESEYCLAYAKPAAYVAARFAAKEAVSKAFGTGIGASIGWHDIEVRRRGTGAPYVALHGRGELLLAGLKANVIHLSLSHTGGNAVAVAVLERVSHLTDA